MAQVNFNLREVYFTDEEVKRIDEAKKNFNGKEITLDFDEVSVIINDCGVGCFAYNPFTDEEEEFNV